MQSTGYSYTPLAAVEAARRILRGEFKPEFTWMATVEAQALPLAMRRIRSRSNSR
jgi:hypothetical protein